MNTVERFHRVMLFQPVDRLPAIEWAPWWKQTTDRWRTEGLPPDLDTVGVQEFLGLDLVGRISVTPRGPDCPKAPHHGAPIIRNRADYLALKPRLYPNPGFNIDNAIALSERQRRGELILWLVFDGYFWFPRTLLGIEEHLRAFYDEPDLMREMNEDLLAHQLRTIEALRPICRPDFMTFAEDMSYNHGPMLSKKCYDAFVAPFYARAVPALKDWGVGTMVDSDGNVTAMVPWLEASGIEGLLPWERQSGVDVAAVRRTHPRFTMIGAFDKTVMKYGEAAMRREFERLLPVMRTGGFIPSVDHQTPPDVSLEQYRVYVRLLREYCLRVGK